MLLTGIPLFRVMSEVSALLTSQKNSVPCQPSGRSCHPVRTPICPLFHPSGRRALPFGRRQIKHHPSGRSAFSVRTSTVSKSYCSIIASVRTSQQPVRTPPSDRSASDSFQVQFKGRLLQQSRRLGFPSGRIHT
jgi:hypothetical protein